MAWKYAQDNKLDVWNVASQKYSGAHFATFPRKLIEPCLLAGTSEQGCCMDCGAPWRRVVEEEKLRRERPNDWIKMEETDGNKCSARVAGVASTTVGWQPTCECYGMFEKTRVVKGRKNAISAPGWSGSSALAPLTDAGELPEEITMSKVEYVSDTPLADHPVQPCVVLDPFIGSGTTCCVSLFNGRRSVGIDLSEKYLLSNAIPRIEGELLCPELQHLKQPRKRGVVGGGTRVS